MIERRPLGAYGENVSALGLGLGALARAGAEAPWEATIDAAIDAGMTSIDAAQARFRRPSELRLGEILGPRRDALFLSTRCSPLDGEPFDASPAGVRKQLEQSLLDLRTDRIDLYHVHDLESSKEKRIFESLLPALIDARERGEVRYVGASSASLDLLERIAITFPVDAIFSYARLDLVTDELRERALPAAVERGIAVINASPLHMGVLARPDVTARGVEENEPLALAAEKAFALAASRGQDLAQLGLAFAGSEQRVSTTLVGCASPKEVAEDARAFSAELNEEERATSAEVRELFRAAQA